MKKAIGNPTILILLPLFLGLMHLNLPAADSHSAEADKAAELLALFESEENITNSLSAIMVWTPSGVRVGKTEVTQAQYQTVMGKNPSRFPGGNRPVEMVSPSEAKQFCSRLTQMEQDSGVIPPGYSYGLPSQNEFDAWIQGTTLETAYVSLVGDRPATTPVASLPANPLGLHDVRGNVWEWCDDQTARGGSYQSHEDYLAPAFRFVGDANMKVMDIGFRIVLRAGK